MKKFVFILLNLLIISTKSFGQFSKTHYIPPLSSSTVFAGEQYLYISTPKTTPVNVKIIEIGGSTILGTVTRDNPYIYYVGYGNDTQLHVDSSLANGILNNKGYIVEAEDQVYVSARVIDQSGNQAGELVSKGLAALGTHFRSGALLNTNVQSYQDFHYTFIAVLATENNTTVDFSGFPAGATFVNGGTGTVPSVVLNSGESYVIAVQGPNTLNRDALVGSLITSDKPIVVNCGSYGGSNAAGNLPDRRESPRAAGGALRADAGARTGRCAGGVQRQELAVLGLRGTFDGRGQLPVPAFEAALAGHSAQCRHAWRLFGQRDGTHALVPAGVRGGDAAARGGSARLQAIGLPYLLEGRAVERWLAPQDRQRIATAQPVGEGEHRVVGRPVPEIVEQ